jgi:two-component system, chemotaxis family, response regulator Rcp1
MSRETEKPVEILLVEDNPGDVQLIELLLDQTRVPHRISLAKDGQEATEYVFDKVPKGQAPRPELIILDLNLPRKDGRTVLKEIKENKDTRGIPVLILTTSHADEDISRCYEVHANCFVTKPTDLARFNAVMRSIEDFWLSTVQLPEPRLVKGKK